jgi:hypothetical protein
MIFLATKGDAKLSTITVTKNNGEPFWDANKQDFWSASELGNIANADNEIYTDTITILEQDWTAGNSYDITISLTDKDGLASMKVVTISVEAPSTPGTEYTATIMYAPTQDNTSKSFIDLSTNTTYSVTEGNSSSASIDLGYYYGASASATLASPGDYLGTIDLSGWATKNSTTLVSASSAYTSYTSEADVIAGILGGTSNTDLTGLSANDVILFKTANDEYGVLKVNSVSGTFNQGDNINITYTIF